MKVQIVLFDGFGELVAFAPYEVLKRAKEIGAQIDVQLVASEPKTEIISSYGVKVMVDDHLRIDNQPDVLIIPGGGWNHKAAKGARKKLKGEIYPN